MRVKFKCLRSTCWTHTKKNACTSLSAALLHHAQNIRRAGHTSKRHGQWSVPTINHIHVPFTHAPMARGIFTWTAFGCEWWSIDWGSGITASKNRNVFRYVYHMIVSIMKPHSHSFFFYCNSIVCIREKCNNTTLACSVHWNVKRHTINQWCDWTFFIANVSNELESRKNGQKNEQNLDSAHYLWWLVFM